MDVWPRGRCRVCRTNKKPGSPSDKSLDIVGDRRRRGIRDLCNDGIEHGTSPLGQFAHDPSKFAVEVA